MEIIILLAFSLLWGWRCAVVASNKGRDSNTWFWVGFFTGILGLIVLVLLPDIKNSSNNRSTKEITRHTRLDVEILRICNSGKKLTTSDIIIEIGGNPDEIRDHIETLVVKGFLTETIENGKHFYEAT